MPKSPYEDVLRTIRGHDMIRPGERVLAAVSGGPDSVFLLVALRHLQKKLRIASLAVCSLDHRLRGRESALDLASVKKLAASLGIACVTKNVDCRKLASAHKSSSCEEVARKARYKFFADAARRTNSAVIATGHTLDDQAETVLMRFIKGSSTRGLTGIPPVRQMGKVRIVRPLIEIEKKVILQYLKKEGVRYRIDSSNAAPDFFRNVVRNEILPFLARHNPRIKYALSNLSGHAREDYNLIKDVRSGIAVSDDPSVIPLKKFLLCPRALQKEILRDAITYSGGALKKLTRQHWVNMETVICRKGRGGSADLPGGLRMRRTARDILFEKLRP